MSARELDRLSPGVYNSLHLSEQMWATASMVLNLSPLKVMYQNFTGTTFTELNAKE